MTVLLSNRDTRALLQEVPAAEGKSFEMASNQPSKIQVAAGGEVYLDGAVRLSTAEELAAKTDTISYEVFCRVSRRVPRLYA